MCIGAGVRRGLKSHKGSLRFLGCHGAAGGLLQERHRKQRWMRCLPWVGGGGQPTQLPCVAFQLSAHRGCVITTAKE